VSASRTLSFLLEFLGFFACVLGFFFSFKFFNGNYMSIFLFFLSTFNIFGKNYVTLVESGNICEQK